MHLILFVFLFVGAFASVKSTGIKNASLLLKSYNIPAKVQFMLADLDENADPQKIDEIISLIQGVISQSKSDYEALEQTFRDAEEALGSAQTDETARQGEKTTAEEGYGSATQRTIDALSVLTDATNAHTEEGGRLQADIDGLNAILTSLCDLVGNCGLPIWPNDFFWTQSAPIADTENHCLHFNEPADEAIWHDNWLCWDVRKTNPGFQFLWYESGKANLENNGMSCVSLDDPDKNEHHTWVDNYICVPENSPYHFQWSYAGPIDDLACIELEEVEDPDWNDNYLCALSG